MRIALVPMMVALAACTPADGDYSATPALVDLSLDASTDLLAQRQSNVSGTIELGYTDARMVDLTIYDNGVPVFTESRAADKLTLAYDATVDLLHPDANALTAVATYQGQQISTAATVAVPGALQDLTVTPSGTDLAAMELTVDVAATLGFVSERDATLVITVDGDVAVARSLDASSTAVSTSERVPLTHLGPSAVEVRLSYEGAVLTDSFEVTATAPAPAVTLPTWSTALDPGVQMLATGQMEVIPADPWTTAAVRVSDDGGLTWVAADPAGGDLWDVTLVDPDIGPTPLLFDVDLVHNGVVATTRWEGEIVVQPVFDCTSPQSMQPTTELIEDHKTEVRTLVGYFGDPDGGHTVSFTLDVSVPGDGLYQVVGATQNYGRFAIDTEFVTERLRCGGACTIDYDLTVTVDGQFLCAETNYGVIREF